jgi:YidC/Oxa1 family membrane protein insertase
MFESFFDALASVLNFFYTLIPSYGVAIMLLTVSVMVLITPLTVKSTRSMLQMQRMQPEMKRIQAKYKNDREKLNEELMKFYRENQINPLGGCLPILAQMPVFIIVYQLLRGLTVRDGGLGSGVGHIGAQLATGQPLTPWLLTDQNFRPTHLNADTELYRSLSSTNTMNFLGMDLSLSPADALRIGIVALLPYLLLLLIMLGTGIYQNRQLQARNTSANVNPQQQMLMKVMPFFLPVFAWAFPAGLALYWCTQNVCRIGTNAYITRSVYRKEHQPALDAAAAREAAADDEPAQPGGRGATKAAKSSGGRGKGGGADTTTGDSDQADRQPGKSVRSQKAHQNAAGRRPSGSGSGAPGGKRRASGRRSGEPRTQR